MSQAKIIFAKYRTLSTSSAYSSCSDDLEFNDNQSSLRNEEFNSKNLKRYSLDQLPLTVVKHYDKTRRNQASDALIVNAPLAKCPRTRNNSSIGSLSSGLDCFLDEERAELRRTSGNDCYAAEMEDLGAALQNLFKTPKASSLAKGCENGKGLDASRKSVTFCESVQRSFFRAGDTINRCRRKMHKVKLKEADDFVCDLYKNLNKEVYYPTSKSGKTRRKRNKEI